MKDIYFSRKLGICIRRIEIAGISYSVHPSFVLSYLAGFADDAEHALFLRKFSVPFRGSSLIYGKDPMYWQRIEQETGRNSIVGTTFRKPEKISGHLGADEKHTSILGEKACTATTVAEGCVPGASVAADADLGWVALTNGVRTRIIIVRRINRRKKTAGGRKIHTITLLPPI